MNSTFNPHEEEMDEIVRELEGAKDKVDYSHVGELVDKFYFSMLDTSLDYARQISALRELHEEGKL